MSTERAEANDGPDAGDLRREWERWREKRAAAVAAPYGPLSVTGTRWIAEAEDGAIAGLPGRWAESADGESVLLEAGVADGLAVDDELLAGEVRLGEDDEGDPGASRVSYGPRRLVLMRREGQWVVRVFDPEAPSRRAFQGIDAFPYDPAWVRPGAFRAYEEGERSVLVGNADGRERGLGLAGHLIFTEPGGGEHRLQVAVVAGGGLWAVLADGTSGRTSYPFRFLRTGAPRAGNAVTVDFNRTTLPPCAFTDNFLCPFPPPGNRLPFDVPAGERNVSGT
ncbi:DUF1684 domain-containing protein [Streptomyces albiaxialis]|uniref:DUF1684 domain-containing protein n=1 Tax=Streptomyces albiaxialis TaxID=329523 RepID=A0ABP5HQU6_9ACTN